MINGEPDFVFESAMAINGSQNGVPMPMRIETKQSLMIALVERLHFPDYFGGNWDALEECIRDLSWLQPGPVILVHSDLPLANDPSNAKIYLSILQGAVHKMANSKDHPLTVAFPEECRQQIEWLLRTKRAQDSRKQ